MQPETKPETKENLEASRENKKKILPVADMTGPEQWDALAFKLIQQELAPKGFSEIKRGPYRGTVQSNIPFLPKKTVERCQNLAAQCVRSYRAQVVRALKDQLKKAKDSRYSAQLNRDNCCRLQFKKRRALQSIYLHYHDEVELLTQVIDYIENCKIASPK